jgi:hypothetical protein
MHKLLSAAFILAILVLLASCVTMQVKAIKPGRALTTETGYIALYFTKKIEFITFGDRNVYVLIKKMDTNARFYVPFGAGGELRLISVPPGDYRIADFVYMIGVKSVEGVDAAQEIPGVIMGVPQRSGTMLIKAAYPENYCLDFKVNAGEIVYIGDYLWDSTITFTGTAVTISRNFKNDRDVYYAVQQRNPGMPESINVFSIPQE